MNTSTALNLLDNFTPSTDELPERIEELNITAYDLSLDISALKDASGRIEEEATAEASSETNADKRKIRRCEILRASVAYSEIQTQIEEAERVHIRLTERSHRLAREFRAHLVNRQLHLAAAA